MMRSIIQHRGTPVHHARRQQDSARANRDYQQRMSNYNNPHGSRASGNDRPGRMLDVADTGKRR